MSIRFDYRETYFFYNNNIRLKKITNMMNLLVTHKWRHKKWTKKISSCKIDYMKTNE